MVCEKKRLLDPRKVLSVAFFVFLQINFIFPAALAAQKNNNARGPSRRSVLLDADHAYSAAAPGKSLLTSSQYVVIDDFNGGGWKTRINSVWRLENAKAGWVKMEHTKEDGRYIHPGYSLKIDFDLRRQQEFTLYASLEKLDMSRGRFLIMKCRTVPAPRGEFDGKIKVALTDWTGKTATQDVTDSCSETKNWGEAILPLKLFKGLDFDQLKQISFTVANTEKHSRAAFWLDEIAFFGQVEVGFESAADNVKDFPEVVNDYPARYELRKFKDNKEFLDAIGRSTWRYFEDAVDKKNNIVLDHVKVGNFPMVGLYTSPTNIAMDLMSTIAANELGYISRETAAKRIEAVFKTLGKLKKWKGFYYNFYETTKLTVNREFISSIDNAWLAAALMVVRQAFKEEFSEEATKILDGFQFQEFLEPDNNHMAIGFDTVRKGFTPYQYGMLVTEARILSFIGIGKKDLPVEHWWYLYRTAPNAWSWQTQKPKGRWKSRDGVEYFQGYYEVDGKMLVPSWGGSLFEFLMPTLVIPETKIASQNLGLNDKIATFLHRDYALNEQKYPVWGISPAAVADGRRWQYHEYGIRKLGVRGYPDKKVIAPYATFLALETLPEEAIENLRKLLLYYDIYGEYGFYDSINLTSKRVTYQYLALDQGMELIAIANYLKDGAIQRYFMQDPIAQEAKGLFDEEAFFSR